MTFESDYGMTEREWALQMHLKFGVCAQCGEEHILSFLNLCSFCHGADQAARIKEAK